MAYNFFISYDGLAGSGKIFLDGASIAAPVRGSRYSPGRGTRSLDPLGRETITEEIQVELFGSYRTLTDWITNLNTRFEVARAGAGHTPTSRLLLCFQESDDTQAYYWFSDVLEAWLLLDAAGLVQRNAGQQLVTLRVTRLDRWESTNTVDMSITFPAGGSQVSQGYMLNHCDATAGHTNWGYFAGTLTGDLPARLGVQVRTQQGGLSMGDALVGCGWSDVGSPNVANFLPTIDDSAMAAGAGVTKNTYGSAACAGGNYATFTWSTTAETQLFKCTVPTTLYSQDLSQGRPYKPFIRLQVPQAYTDLWLKIRVLAGPTSIPIYETEYILYNPASYCIEFPPVYLPPEGLQETQQLELAIYALKTSAAAYALAVDFLQAWPVDGGFRRYHGLSYISGNGQIFDSSPDRRVYWSNNTFTQFRAVYTAQGPLLLANPGKTNVFAFLHLHQDATWVIDDQIELWINATPAKRNL